MALSKKAKRIIWIVVALIVVVPVVALLVVLTRLGTIIKVGFEQAGPPILGVETRLDDASVYPLTGKVVLSGMAIGNPEGYKAPTLMRANLIRVGADIGSLLKKEVHIREAVIDGAEFTIEYKGGKSNLDALTERLSGGEEKEPAAKPKEKGGETKLKIDLIHVTNAKVRVMVGSKPVTISLPDVKITDIADKDGNAVPPSQVAKVFFRKIAGPIEKVAGAVGKVADMTKEVGGKIAEKTGLDKAGKGAKEAGGKLLKGAKKLFGK